MVHNPHSVLVEAVIPTRGLIGFETDLVNVTKGLGIASHLFKEYGPHKGEIPSRDRGVLVAMEGGVSTAYSLDTIQERGRLFIGVQEEIYEGMIIGENARPDDLPVNPCKAKKLNNMRSQGDGKGISLAPPLVMTLERSIEYIAPDEYVEATPKSLRLRKEGARRRPAQADGEHRESVVASIGQTSGASSPRAPAPDEPSGTPARPRPSAPKLVRFLVCMASFFC